MMTVPLCPICKHVLRYKRGERPTCEAFPDGIPDEIVHSEFAHVVSYPDSNNPQDGGIRFMPQGGG